MSEKLENRNKEEKLTCGPAPVRPGRPSSQRRPSPLAPPLSSSSSTGGWARARRARAPPRHATSLPACLPSPLLVWMPRETPRPPVPSHSLSFLPPSSALSLARSRAELIAAVHRSRSHRLPLASPTRAGAPPPRPEALRQATRRRTPCGAAVAIVFLLGLRPPSPSICRLQRVPEPASTPTATAVSYATVSLSSPPRSRAVTPFPTTAEPPPSPSSPSTQLR